MSEKSRDRTIQDLGEQGLLQILHQFCPPHIIGDDAALWQPQAGWLQAITTDVLIDGVHFSDRTTPPHAVGWRAAAVNLSDLAAMGAMPVGLTVGLGLPASTSESWVQGVYQGIQDCLQKWGGVILGGDVVRSPQKLLSITAIGEVKPEQKILRHTAQPGDAIVVTGYHGGSRAGLEVLLNPDWAKQLSPSEQNTLIHTHQYPQPRLDVVQILQKLHYSATGMDSSDGLADAVLQICHASGVGAELKGDRLPIHPALQHAPIEDDQRLHWTLYGGEDFELVLTMPPQQAETLMDSLGAGAAMIGEMTSTSDVTLNWQNRRIDLSLDQGFQHW